MRSLLGRDLLRIEDLNQDEIYYLISRSIELKRSPLKAGRPLEGRSIALIFHKPSMRTRVSFEAAASALGANPIFLRSDEVGLGEREPAKDVARVLSRYVAAIVIRTFDQSLVEEFAENSDVPVINALTDEEHPCQAIADLMTILEKKNRIAGLKLAFIGDGRNNVARSLMLAGASAGMKISIASPEGFKPEDGDLERARCLFKGIGEAVKVCGKPEEAVERADVVYTDVWVSMGQEAEKEEKVKAFAGYQVSPELMKRAKQNAIVMHCLPAHRGQEIAEGVLESPRSVVFDQAENRLHTAKAILLSLVGG